MAKFFVGQRVKKVRGRNAIGLTGIVSAVGLENHIRPLRTMRVKIDSPAMGEAIRFNRGDMPYTDPHEWEPILDPGATPSVFRYEELMDGLRSGELVAP